MNKRLPNSTLSHKELREQGYKVDDTCYHNVYYKGPRHNPIEYGHVLTLLEKELLAACKYTIEQLRTVKGKTFPIMPIINAIAKAEGSR